MSVTGLMRVVVRGQWPHDHHPCFEIGAHELVFRHHIQRESAAHERAMHASTMAGGTATCTCAVPVDKGLRELLPLVSTVVNVRVLMFVVGSVVGSLHEYMDIVRYMKLES